MKPTVDFKNNTLVMIDQRKLPHQEIYVRCRNHIQAAKAIKEMVIRGAPAIGVAAAYGVVLAAHEIKTSDPRDFVRKMEKPLIHLAKARPTAINLFWAIDRMTKCLKRSKNLPVKKIKENLLKEARSIEKEDLSACRQLNQHGAKLFKKGQTILTICNTGGLATAGIGTALGVLIEAHRKNKKIKVIAAETRPYLQGARLTAWELKKARVPFHLITDNMAGALMSLGRINAVIVGADRVAANGDTANKIGTYSFAVLANYHRIPFYVALPTSSIDLNIKSGKEIPIEQRSAEEVTHLAGRAVAPHGTPVINPAFDVTPAKLIKGIITEKGIVKPNQVRSLKGRK